MAIDLATAVEDFWIARNTRRVLSSRILQQAYIASCYVTAHRIVPGSADEAVLVHLRHALGRYRCCSSGLTQK